MPLWCRHVQVLQWPLYCRHVQVHLRPLGVDIYMYSSSLSVVLAPPGAAQAPVVWTRPGATQARTKRNKSFTMDSEHEERIQKKLKQFFFGVK
jgi:hypothetical protein